MEFSVSYEGEVMIVNNRIQKTLLFATIFLISLCLFPLPVHADQSSAQSEITSARLKLADCYSAVRAAEAASANISELTSTLNNAGNLFSRAEFAYSNGDFNTAQSFAAQSQNLLDNFVSNANSLEAKATFRRDQDFLFNVIGSIAGFVAVLFGSSIVWVLLKRKYEKDESVGT